MNFKHLACLATLLLTCFAVRGDIVYPKDRADRDYNTTVTEKFDRGLQNVCLFWLEIPRAWWSNTDWQSYNGAGLFKGSFDGLRNAGVRFGQGMFDMFTFPWNTGNFELPWQPPPPQVNPEWVPALEWAFPGGERVDEHMGDGVYGWEGQLSP